MQCTGVDFILLFAVPGRVGLQVRRTAAEELSKHGSSLWRPGQGSSPSFRPNDVHRVAARQIK